MRAKLRDDLLYVAVENGVYLETGRGSTEISGGSAYRLVQQLAPHLDGSRTVEALTAGLPPAQQRLIAEMVTMLVRRGLARDLDTEPPHGLQDWELDRYRQAILYAEHVADAPVHRFEGFRDARVLLVGAGPALHSLVQTLFDLGLRAATVMETGEEQADGEAYRRILERCRDGDPTVTLRRVPDTTAGPDAEAALTAALGGFDAVLHCTGHELAGRALAVTRAAHAAGIPALHAVPDGDAAWVGPTGGGVAAGCWECAVRSAHGAAPADGDFAAHDRPDRRSAPLSAPMGTLLGAVLGFAYFRGAVAGPGAGANTMTHLDLASGETSEHLLGVHPRCGTCGGRDVPRRLAEQVAGMAGRPPLDADAFASRVTALIDRRLGPVVEVGTGEHSQLSVSCLAATVADLTGAGTGPRVVTAVGTSRRQALVRATVAGLELLAAEAATTATGPEPPGTGAGDGSEPPTAEVGTGPERPAPRTTVAGEWWDPLAGTIVPVAGGGSYPVVVAGGLSWAEAQGRAALRLAHATADGPPGPGDAAGPGGWGREHWPTAARRLADDLAVLGHELRAWRAATDVPTVFVGTGEGWLAHACATDPGVALELATQAAAAIVTGRGPDGADVGPDAGAGAWDGELETLLRSFAANGRRLLLRPVDHLPALRDVLPFVVAATLTEGTGGNR
ncbi:TOMM precursor leader peptide-binding protein [Micromonospora sp. NPDC048170]|uniref:TOMM precursor leader peptide-binding protein n=1 Tax=Micromonospora sp. NPDC048170 TaxID=3154819 RepID=UPI0033F48518